MRRTNVQAFGMTSVSRCVPSTSFVFLRSQADLFSKSAASTVLAGDLARPLQRKNSSLESPFPAEIDENDARDRRDSAQPDEPLLKSERLRNAGRRSTLPF